MTHDGTYHGQQVFSPAMQEQANIIQGQELGAQKLELGKTFFNIGMAAQIGGSLIAQIGAYGQAQAAQSQARSGAMTAEHQATMDELGAAQARVAANSILREGARARQRYGLRAGQEQGTQRARTAARGVQGGVGSSAEVQASLRYAQIADQQTIDSNAMRQAQALERQRLSLRNRARMGRVTAQNLRDQASAISPGLAVATEAMRGLAGVAMGFSERFS